MRHMKTKIPIMQKEKNLLSSQCCKHWPYYVCRVDGVAFGRPRSQNHLAFTMTFKLIPGHEIELVLTKCRNRLGWTRCSKNEQKKWKTWNHSFQDGILFFFFSRWFISHSFNRWKWRHNFRILESLTLDSSLYRFPALSLLPKER